MMKQLLKGWMLPVGLFAAGIIYVILLWNFKEGITFKVWYNQLAVFVFPTTIWLIFKCLIASGVETPKQVKARKQREADDEAREISYYRSLSEEGKLLYDLNKKQDRTEKFTRAIYGAIIGGAVFYLLSHIWF